ncbi:G-box-binding factor 4-like isoform X3 [Cucurbita moschata]|uniref:G-box-binding factor 4-like isoform X3 n=1 Tax=Cucurbita moschata TaxID=3662 RepID=A0A6J1HH41_CUCMO|nr:G-box-binding factor 4-like isoform X3 [Cucurbita moschata]
MASSKLWASSGSRNSDLSRGSSSSSSSASLLNPQFLSNSSRNNDNNRTRNRSHSLSSMNLDGLVRDGYHNTSSGAPKTVDDVWREIVSGERKELKEEVTDELITLEDFLVKTGAAPVEDVKLPQTERLSGGIFSFDSIPGSSFQAVEKVEGSIVGFGSGVDLVGSGGSVGRGKRGRAALEPLDKAAEQRQRRMIKNRESAARSRERKQAYQVELESLVAKLEEENERLLREKAERSKERHKQLMEKVIPVVEKRRPPRGIRRVNSMKW